jgi:hypothetical protein
VDITFYHNTISFDNNCWFFTTKGDQFLMGAFQDLGWIKVWNGRMQDNLNAVVTAVGTWDIILLKRDDPLEGLDFEKEENEASDPIVFTLSEFEEFGNGLDGNPIYLSILVEYMM